MKLSVIASVILLATLGGALAQSQMEMNAEAAAEFRKTDRQLNVVYAKVQKSLDDEGRAKLKTAQRAWIAFRDAEAEFQADAEARGGSMAPLILFGTMTRLTKVRVAELEEFFAPFEDR